MSVLLLKLHVNIITGSGIMTIFFYKGLTRNPEIGNSPVWILLYVWRLGRVREIKFVTNVTNKMLLNAARVTAFTIFELLKENQQGRRGGGKITTPATQIRVNEVTRSFIGESIKWMLRIIPHRQETWRKSLSSTKNVVGTFLNNLLLSRFLDTTFDTKWHYKKTGIVKTGCWVSDSLPWLLLFRF